MISIRTALSPADSRIRHPLRVLPPRTVLFVIVVSIIFALYGQPTRAFTSMYQRSLYSPPKTCRHYQPPPRHGQSQPPPHGSTSRTVVVVAASSSSSTRYNNYQEDLLPGIAAIDAANHELLQKLDVLRDKPYFRYYSIDILASCEYMPQELYECYTQTCEIYPEDGDQVRLFVVVVVLLTHFVPVCVLVRLAWVVRCLPTCLSCLVLLASGYKKAGSLDSHTCLYSTGSHGDSGTGYGRTLL
jgi:Endoplasmic Reticulum Oxidoreductin 1 (ERO1)